MNFVKWMKHLLIIQFETLTVNTNVVVVLVLFGSLSCLISIYQPNYIILAHLNKLQMKDD